MTTAATRPPPSGGRGRASLRHWLAPSLLIAALAAFGASLAARIPSAPLDEHSWRQALSASVARNYTCGSSFAYPRVDCCGGGVRDGLVAMEFPLYAYAASILARAMDMRRAFALLNLALGAAFLSGTFLLARRMAQRLGSAPAAVAGFGAASLFAFSPVVQQWSGAWLPDNAAWGLSVLGAGWLAARPPSRARDLAAPTALVALGILCKTIAWPVAGLTFFLAATSPRSTPRRALLFAVGHAAIVAGAWIAWYRLWNVHLSSLAVCEIFALGVPKASQVPGLLRARDVWESIPGKLQLLLGPARWVAFAGAPIALLLGWRLALSLLTYTAGALGIFLLLGWHTEVHGYDALVFVIPAALGLGAAAAGASWLLGRIQSAPTTAALAMGLAVAAAALRLAHELRPSLEPHLVLQASPTLAHELDLFLPAASPFVATYARADPRPSFFSARRVYSPERPMELCEADASFRYDCADQTDFYSLPCAGPPRWSATVFFPRHTLMCGLQEPRALERLRSHLLSALPPSAAVDEAAPGLGQVLGFDASWEAGKPHIDLFVERSQELPQPLERIGIEARLQPSGGGAEQRVESWVTLDSVHLHYRDTPVINVLRLQGAFSEGTWRVRLLQPGLPETFAGIEAAVSFPPREAIEGFPYRTCAGRR